MNTGPVARSSLRILVVDDQSSIRRIVQSQLVSIGFTSIVQAANAKEAVEKLHTTTFSLIISDWHMPEMSGFELLQYVRSSTLHEKTPFILLTTETERENVIRAAQSGVTFYLTKPFTTEVLEKRVLQAIFSSKSRD
jgi:two-component system chemotaxis response regulator CheY